MGQFLLDLLLWKFLQLRDSLQFVVCLVWALFLCAALMTLWALLVLRLDYWWDYCFPLMSCLTLSVCLILEWTDPCVHYVSCLLLSFVPSGVQQDFLDRLFLVLQWIGHSLWSRSWFCHSRRCGTTDRWWIWCFLQMCQCIGSNNFACDYQRTFPKLLCPLSMVGGCLCFCWQNKLPQPQLISLTTEMPDCV